jgi:two-component sensor histidine kinase
MGARHAYPGDAGGTVTLTTTHGADSVIIACADTGIGVLPATLPKTGLGTSIMAALSRQIGATLRLSRRT